MNKLMKIALLSHRDGNIGHNFMAIGVEELIRRVFGDKIEISHFEQHNHFCTYPKMHPLRLIHSIPHGRLAWLRRWVNAPERANYFFNQCSDLSKYSLAIGCGGPNFVRGVGESPEMGLMLHHLYGAFSHQKVPVIDLAVGSCFPLERIPKNISSAFTSEDKTCLDRLLGVTKQTTVRDKLAHSLISELGRNAPLIPCAALCSGIVFKKWAEKNGSGDKDTILINFQYKGANDDWNQNVNPKKWSDTVRKVASHFSRSHKVIFICHSRWEKKIAKKLFPDFESYMPKTPHEYALLIDRAKAALVSRIHCAIPLAGIGTPSVVVGTDSRTWATDEIGLNSRYVKDVNSELLIEDLTQLINNKESKGFFNDTIKSTIEKYKDLFINTIET